VSSEGEADLGVSEYDSASDGSGDEGAAPPRKRANKRAAVRKAPARDDGDADLAHAHQPSVLAP